MFDKPYDFSAGNKFKMGLWIGRQMTWGAALASIFVGFLLGLFLFSYFVGMFLPERSKQAPSPYTALEVVSVTEIA
ncbi:photosynthetic reaction center PufX protein [Rhodobacter aestuarii]|uniref:Photosynthetic reaction center PufX protein n=1 Tax=Rhodobacter aestuarii TaxID=453582 RepID=A0A1N7MJF4_9RHOB|nr:MULTISPECIES: RC-LH1 core complex protein PufX [Rhodobacter]PTV96714.1 photosynthetic reaction center PufX protein [Rhodobacter aestuarii]SIS86304.1 photosynthetic reaction center PufX protein [Rhodobacter aestuarii]SOB90616.1 photosynthetic reaction center PufX protein [Rhodobacter sp. JA431]